MKNPILSEHFKQRKPSPIRLAQIEFLKRNEKIETVNVAIGNVSLPMHPSMQKRLFSLNASGSPFKDGVVKYTPTAGNPEVNKAFLNIIASSGFDTKELYSLTTDGGSSAMELVILGVCGPAGTSERPLMLIDAAYTNYISFAERTGRKTISVRRTLLDNGKFSLPNLEKIEEEITKHKPGGLVVIPYDNPTGHFYDKVSMIMLAKLCVKYNMWMISDEAYRELYYCDSTASSIWGIDESLVPGIKGRRISIETASKVWNACGLRIGSIVTDNKEFHEKTVAEYTANLCSNAIGQYIFGALANEKHEDLKIWYGKQRAYYRPMMTMVREKLLGELPGIIMSSPDAALYSVIDVRNIAKPGFKSADFVLYCVQKGKVNINGKDYTLLIAPMSGFYSLKGGEKDPGDTQMRIAYVEHPEKMALLPDLFVKLFKEYEANR